MKIDDPTLHDELSQSLRRLNALAKILKNRRGEAGYIYQSVTLVLYPVYVRNPNYVN